MGIQQYFFVKRKAGLRLNTSPLPVHGSASLILMRKYEVTEFLGWGFPTVGSCHEVFISIQQYFYKKKGWFQMK